MLLKDCDSNLSERLTSVAPSSQTGDAGEGIFLQKDREKRVDLMSIVQVGDSSR